MGYLKDIARELYALERQVSDLAAQADVAPAGRKAFLEDQLRKVTAERDRFRGLLEGRKTEPLGRRPR